jgi:hypothetical protein
MVCHMSLLTWSVDVDIPHVLADVVCHMFMLTWSANVDLPNVTVIVCSPDPMVLIHFGFSSLWASGLSNLKLKILEVRFSGA